MRSVSLALLSCGLALCGATASLAQQASTAAPTSSAPAPSASASQPTDRLTFSGDGATLTNTDGGGGGSVGYLHGFSPALLVGAGAEYQKLYTADWAFGSLNAAYSHPLTATTVGNIHGEIHEGSGHSAGESFRYGIEALGVGSSIPGGFALDLEERQIDVFTSHGSLPKVSLAKAWGTRWLTSVSYAYSFGGNLNTNYSLARVDYYGAFLNLLAGGSVGRVNPVVLGINGVLEGHALHSHEVFAGVTKRFGRFDLSLLGDYIDLEGNKHFIGTLAGTWYLR